METENFIAKIRVVPGAGKESEASSFSIDKFTDHSLATIAGVINRTITSLDSQLVAQRENAIIEFKEIELTFGIDFEAGTNIPILGPIFGTQVKTGTTFQVTITLQSKAQKEQRPLP